MAPVNQGIEERLFLNISHTVADNAFYQMLGIELMAVGPGWAELAVNPGPQHINLLGTVHGGLIMSLVDASMGNAIRSLGIKAVTVQLGTSYFQSAPMDKQLLAHGEVQKKSKNLIFVRSDVYSGGELIAQGSATFYRIGAVL